MEWIYFAQNRNILASSNVKGCETSGSIKRKKMDLLTKGLLAAQETLLHGVTQNRIKY